VGVGGCLGVSRGKHWSSFDSGRIGVKELRNPCKFVQFTTANEAEQADVLLHWQSFENPGGDPMMQRPAPHIAEICAIIFEQRSRDFRRPG